MDAVNIKIDLLRENEENPRKIKKKSFDKLKKSLQDFPEMLQIRPLIVNSEYKVIGGNMRLKAAREIGLRELPCVVVDLPKEKEKEFVVKDNLNYGEWDYDIIAERFDVRDLLDWGFDERYLKNIASDVAVENTVNTAYEHLISAGEYAIIDEGKHYLYCCDCEHFRHDVKADILLTDPPYNVGYKSRRKKHAPIANDKLEGDVFLDFLNKKFDNIKKHISPSAAIYIFYAANVWEFYLFFHENFHVKTHCIWLKSNIAIGHGDYSYQYEPFIYASLSREVRPKFRGGRGCSNVFEYPLPVSNDVHPTMKPVELLSDIICKSTDEGDIVLDPFAGSGSTLLAAEINNRRAVCVEIDERYCNIILDRYLRSKKNAKIDVRKIGE